MNLIGITGKNISELREAKGWTQQKLADLLKVEIVTVSRWERAVDKEASIKSTMYAVLLPILVSTGIRLSIAKELREDRTKLFEKLAKITAVGLSTGVFAGSALISGTLSTVLKPGGAILGGLVGALGDSSWLFAAKAINSWFQKAPDSGGQTLKPSDRIPDEVEKALLFKELADIQNLYLQQKEAWKKIEKDFSLSEQADAETEKKGKGHGKK